MKNLKNIFILIVVLLIFLVIWTQVFIKNTVSYNDTSSYVTLIKGKWLINTKSLEVDIKEKLSVWDTIETIWKDSLSVIEWWDWSITRLWWDTKLIIKEENILSDLTEINISVELLSWKIWSNVVSFLWEKSYFKQYFNDIEAWVRWTTFSVDLENNYVYSLDHDVTLITKENETFTVHWWEAFSLKNFSLIDIKEFFSKVIDKSFEELNNKLDLEYISVLKANLNEKIEKNNPFSYILWLFSKKHKALYEIRKYEDFVKTRKLLASLNTEDKIYIYNKTYYEYQKLNFVWNNDTGFFARKIFYKRVLLFLAKEKDKELLVENTFNDFKDSVSSGNENWIWSILEILNENKDILNKLDIDFESYFSSLKIPDWLKESFNKNLDQLKNIFWNNIINSDFSFDSLKNNLNNIKDNAEDKITDWLNILKNKFTD